MDRDIKNLIIAGIMAVMFALVSVQFARVMVEVKTRPPPVNYEINPQVRANEPEYSEGYRGPWPDHLEPPPEDF